MKRANRTGSIYKDKRRKGYIVAISVGYNDKNGRQIRRTAHAKTLAEANKKLDALKAKYNAHTKKELRQISLVDYIKSYIDSYKLPYIKPQTYYNYKSLVRTLEKNNISKCKISDITSIELNDALNKITSLSSKKKIYNIINSALKMAANDKIIDYNPAASIKIRETAKRTKEPLTPSDYQKILTSPSMQEQTPRLIFKLLWFTGARVGEILALTWDGLNTEKNSITINGTVAYYDKIIDVSTPKTTSSYRVVSIPKKLIQKLREHKKRQAAIILSSTSYANNDLIFADERGRPLKIYSIKYKLQKALNTLKHKHTPHDIRHTHTTIMLNAGYNIKEVQKRLGHSRVTTTLDIYAHAKEETDTNRLFAALCAV